MNYELNTELKFDRHLKLIEFKKHGIYEENKILKTF